jgi:Protein of unknown function (DUF1706)
MLRLLREPEAFMGKRLGKKELVSDIQRERMALDAALALIPARHMTRAGVTRGGWSVKDVLAHLVEWQQMNLDWYAAGLRGEKPAMPAPGFTLRELPRLNAMISSAQGGRVLKRRSVLAPVFRNDAEETMTIPAVAPALPAISAAEGRSMKLSATVKGAVSTAAPTRSPPTRPPTDSRPQSGPGRYPRARGP